MSSTSKKRQIAEENRVFQEKWEDLYFFTEVNGKIQCLVCQQTIAVAKEYNIRRHYDTFHREKFDGIKGKMREDKIHQLKASFAKQRQFFTTVKKVGC